VECQGRVESMSCRENNCAGVVKRGGVLCSGDSGSDPGGSGSSTSFPSPLLFSRSVWASGCREVAAVEGRGLGQLGWLI
jgi:hypothetical protein